MRNFEISKTGHRVKENICHSFFFVKTGLRKAISVLRISVRNPAYGNTWQKLLSCWPHGWPSAALNAWTFPNLRFPVFHIRTKLVSFHNSQARQATSLHTPDFSHHGCLTPWPLYKLYYTAYTRSHKFKLTNLPKFPIPNFRLPVFS